MAVPARASWMARCASDPPRDSPREPFLLNPSGQPHESVGRSQVSFSAVTTQYPESSIPAALSPLPLNSCSSLVIMLVTVFQLAKHAIIVSAHTDSSYPPPHR